MSIAPRKNIQKIEAYVAGKPIEETKRQYGLKHVIKLASNENPLGPSPCALAAIQKCVRQLNRYPDSQGFSFKKALGKSIGFAPSNIILGNGSDELIDILIKTFVEDDENIVTSSLTFLEYAIIAKVLNRKVITAPVKYFAYDLDAIRRVINRKTKIVFIANPNNPTGTYVARAEFDKFLKSLPRSILVVLDEAYDTFIDVHDFPYGLSYVGQNTNVVTLKTFSKGYGLAGLRVGYAVADEKLVSYMEKARQPFNVNLLAQAGAMAALRDTAFLKRTRSTVLGGKAYIYDQLNRLGLAYVPSVANFILVDVGTDGVEIFKKLLKFGIIVRDMKQYGLKNFIRVTIGSKLENEKFVKALKRVL